MTTIWIKNTNGALSVIENIDQIPNGLLFKKTQENFTTELLAKLTELSTTPLSAETIVGRINSSSEAISADRLVTGTSNKLLTANALLGAQNAYALLDGSGLKPDVLIGGSVVSAIVSKANDAFQKGIDTLDEISDGTTKKAINASYVDAEGRPNAIHDGTEKRAIGGARGLAILDDSSKIAIATMPDKAVIVDSEGKIKRGDATPVKVDDLDMTGDYKPIKVKLGEEDLQTRIFWTMPNVSLVGNASKQTMETQSSSYVLFAAIPSVFDNLDKNLVFKLFSRVIAGSGTPLGSIRIVCRPDNGGEPNMSPIVSNYTLIEATSATFIMSEVLKADFFTSWNLTEGDLVWITIEGKVSNVLDKLEIAAPIFYIQSKIIG